MRYCLREWLYEVVQKEEVPTYNFLWLHDELIRLAEAAWLLQQQNKKPVKGKKKTKV
jgi:hypothetical protein